MTDYPRGVDDRLQWFMDNEPGETGQCARWTWLSMGDGVKPSAWGCEDANEVVDKVKKAGGLFTSREAPRGAFVLYTSSTHGHMCWSKGYQDDYDILTTDPPGHPGATGTWTQQGPIDSWGQKWAGWGIRYNGVLLPMSEPGPVHVDRLFQGSGADEPSDSVTRLQDTLNHTSLPAPGNVDLPPTGYYGEDTATVVGVWQTQHGYPKGPLTNAQADALFAGTGHTVIHATQPAPEPEPPDPPEPPETSTLPLGIEYHYSGKPAGTFTFSDTYKRLDVPSWAPQKDGLTFGMLYANVDGSGEFRVRLIRENPSDETAYQTFYPKSGDNLLVTHVWFESGEGGRPLHWELQTMDGETMTVGTRYAKFVTIPWDVTVAAAQAGVAYQRFRWPLAAVLALLAILGILGQVT